MSGGSWGYMYHGLEDVADALQASEYPHRRLLAPVFRNLAKIMHDVEWLDSGDYGQDDLPREEALIREILGDEAYKNLMLQDIQVRQDAIQADIDKLKEIP